jgi:hypothetical protein
VLGQAKGLSVMREEVSYSDSDAAAAASMLLRYGINLHVEGDAGIWLGICLSCL